MMKDRWSVPVTAVANEFIDKHMAAANGEYVKVYLYVLRHQGEDITIERVADALNHTESDVRRALSYWKKAGILMESSGRRPDKQTVSGNQEGLEERKSEVLRHQELSDRRIGSEADGSGQAEDFPVYSADQVSRLAQDEEFSPLLYIAQKYMNKVFTPRECQIFAYLYEGLSMSSELLEYLVEYCVQNGHFSMRYIETVAMSWHERGIRTAQEAKDYSSSYNRDSFAVMKAFGINDRKPASSEQKIMDKWFQDYGFSRELVLEACARTITAIHTPSFQYADKILSEWKKAGVRRLADLEALDSRRSAARQENEEMRDKRLQKYDSAIAAGQNAKRNSNNQFHNFKQRDTDYDALVLKQVQEWVGQQP